MKRIISLLLCCIIAVALLPTTTFAATSGRKIITWGYCGADNVTEEEYRNVKWTWYDDGEVEITGKGDTSNLFYVVNNTEATTLRICEGINTIQFEVENGAERNFFNYSGLNKICIPKSADYLSNLIIPDYTYSNRKIIICYAGTQAEWNALAKEEHFSKNVCDFYFEGEEPAPYCRINCNNGVIDATVLEPINLRVDYYSGNHTICNLRYTFQESKVQLVSSSDSFCTTSLITITPKKKGETKLKVELFDYENNTVIATETVTIRATKNSEGDTTGSYITFIKSLNLPNFLTILLSLPVLPFYWLRDIISK